MNSFGWKSVLWFVAILGSGAARSGTAPADGPVPVPTTAAQFDRLEWTKAHEGERLDLHGYRIVWEDRFDTLAVASDRKTIATAPAGTRWFAPGHPASGHEAWYGPDNEAGYDVLGLVDDAEGRHLRMSLLRDPDSGRWVSPCLQTVDRNGQGFTQALGYFEARIRLPDSQSRPVRGIWPAFWTYTVNRYTSSHEQMVEFDVIELYGGMPADATNRQTHSAVHLVPNRQPLAGGLEKRMHKGRIRTVDTLLFDGRWHRYGGLVTHDWFIVYLDGRELCRIPNFPEGRKPRYLLLDINELSGGNAPVGQGPYHVLVDDVRVWAPPAQATHGSSP